MVRFQTKNFLLKERETEDREKEEKNESKKSSSIIKQIGGRKVLFLGSVILDNPKFKGLI